MWQRRYCQGGGKEGMYMLEFSGNAQEGHLVSASGGTFNLKVVAVIHPESLETFNEEKVDGYDKQIE